MVRAGRDPREGPARRRRGVRAAPALHARVRLAEAARDRAGRGERREGDDRRRPVVAGANAPADLS